MRKLTVKEMLAVSGGYVVCGPYVIATSYASCPGAPVSKPVDACVASGGYRMTYGYCSIRSIR